MTYYIYGLYSGDPGAVRYIGFTSGELGQRLRGHVKTAKRTDEVRVYHQARWVRSLIADGKPLEIVGLDAAPSKADALWLERFWILVYRAVGISLTNSTDGGDGAHNPSPETRARMSAGQLGRRWSDERKKRHSQLLRGRPRPLGVDQARWDATPPERRAEIAKKIGDSQRGKPHNISPEGRERMTAAGRRRVAKRLNAATVGRANKGKVRSEETRRKLSEAKRGKKRSAESIEKQRAKMIGRPKPEGFGTREYRELAPEERKARVLAAREAWNKMKSDSTLAGTHYDVSPAGQGAEATNATSDAGITLQMAQRGQ